MELKLFKELQQQLYKLNPAGSLSDLRKIAGDNPKDKVINDLVGYAHLISFNLFREAQDFAADYFLKSENWELYNQVQKLINFYQQKNKPIYRNNFVDKVFRSYCQQNGLNIIKVLQAGINQIRSASWVYLVKDTDGIVKIFKEINCYMSGPLAGKFIDEDEIFKSLPENNFLPKYFGTIDIDGVKFMKQEIVFGPTIDISQKLSLLDCKKVTSDIALSLDFLHSNGIAYLDLKPENIIADSNKILLIDLGISRRINESEVDIYLADSRFTTPEGTTKLKGSYSSDIFQLGILYHWLLYGKHPFEMIPFQINNLDKDRESALLRYSWTTSMFNYSDFYSTSDNNYSALIAKMLQKEPEQRPTAKEVISELEDNRTFLIPKHWQKDHHKQNNTVLFPARMGIPHKGHIDYINRILNLGYHVLISIQRSYTLTDRDPIPKFLVMKMVAQSLAKLGFIPDKDFSFVLTPYPFDQNEMKYHLINLPQLEDLVGVASGNPGIWKLFENWPIFDQNSVFGNPDQEWQNRSWGEIIRKAVKQNDYSIFQQFAASGIESILKFNEIQQNYGQAKIEFAKTVEVVAVQNNLEIARGRVFRYQTPEQSLFRHLQSFCNFQIKVEDLYQRDTLIELNGRSTKVLYLKTDFEKDLLHESIYFNLISNP